MKIYTYEDIKSNTLCKDIFNIIKHKTSIAKEIQFETDLKEREDLHFIDTVEQAGYSIIQIENVLVEVASSKPFSYRQVDIYQDLYWFKYLSKKSSILNWKFLLTVALRNRLMTFQLFSTVKLLFSAIRVSIKE